MIRVSKLLVLLALAGCASELVLEKDGALAVLPRQGGDSGHIIVDVTLNGHGPFKFALDTGASISVVFDDARTEAGIEGAGSEMIHVRGMTGTGNYPVAEIAQIAVGGEYWNDARIALLPDEGPIADMIDGILGVDFLAQYAVWYSQQEHAVRLLPKQVVAERSYAGWNTIRMFDLDVGVDDVSMLAFDLHIGAERIPALFDLGATVNLMNHRAARLLKVPVRRPRDIPDVWGVTGKTEVLTELVVWRMRLSDMYWRSRTFLIGDFPVFDVLDVGNRPLAIAGSSLFRDRDFIIDFERKRLLVGSRE